MRPVLLRAKVRGRQGQELLAKDRDYDDLGGDYFTRRAPERQRDRLIQQLHNLGYRVTLDRVA